MIRFFSRTNHRCLSAQTYDLPNVSKEFEKFQKQYLKKKP